MGPSQCLPAGAVPSNGSGSAARGVGAPDRSRIRSTRGISLIDLIFVLAVGTILLAMAAPSLKGAFDGQRLIAAADGLSSTLAQGRREALRTSRQTTVVLNPAARTVTLNGFSDAAGTLVQLRLEALPGGVAFNGPVPAAVVFDPLGRPTVLPVTIPLVSTASGRVMTVRVLATGRIEVL